MKLLEGPGAGSSCPAHSSHLGPRCPCTEHGDLWLSDWCLSFSVSFHGRLCFFSLSPQNLEASLVLSRYVLGTQIDHSSDFI